MSEEKRGKPTIGIRLKGQHERLQSASPPNCYEIINSYMINPKQRGLTSSPGFIVFPDLYSWSKDI